MSNKDDLNNAPKFRGLYKNVKISVKSLDIIITVLAIAIIGCIIYGLSDQGYTIKFNSMGGSYIEPQKLMYGQEIIVEEPQRDGYTFDYWSIDEACKIKADLETLRVDGSFELYACYK